MASLFFEDLGVGRKFRSGRGRVEAADIKAFAAAYDPQPFHLDEKAAEASFFRGLAASGWHTAAMTMRLIVEEALPIAGGVIGAGVDELGWPTPVRPGDELEVSCEVIDARPSKSRPQIGIVRVRVTTMNQRDEPVQIMVANLVVPRRAA